MLDSIIRLEWYGKYIQILSKVQMKIKNFSFFSFFLKVALVVKDGNQYAK